MRRLVHLPAWLLVSGLSTSLAVGQAQFAELGKQLLPKDSDTTQAVALGDVDGDRDLDVVFGNVGQNRLYLNDGKGTFTDATATRLPKDSDITGAVALGDVDGDRDLDIVFGNGGGPFQGQQNRLYLSDGKGTFTDATATRLPKDSDVTQAVALGDVDGDRDLDLVFGNTRFAAEQNRLYLNDGKGRFTDVTLSRLPKDREFTLAVALGDVDEDNDLDIVFGNVAQQNRLYLNDGKGKFTEATATRLPKDREFTQAVALGDVDGDRDLDLVFGNSVFLGRQNQLYLNDGKGKFTDATASRLPKVIDITGAVALGDMDGDHDLDIVFGNGGQQNRLYLNLHRQIHAPLLARIGNPYPLDFYAKPGYATSYHLVVPFVSTAEKKTKLPPFGTFGLDLSQTVVLPLMVILPSEGKTTLSLKIPNDPGLKGTTVSSQALIIPDLVFPPTRWRFTNVNADRIVR